jgi:hypothetical protein
MKKTGYVTADHDHFRKAKLEYRNWMQAIFREAIQNSTDAGANSINIDYFYNEQELTIRFSDNGNGMSLDTLLNVLLKMGGSKKDGESTIGGFGYAKSILFFAHNSYFIKTRDYEVNGIGGEYTYNESHDNYKGTLFEIKLTNDYYYTLIENIDKYLNEILMFSFLPHIKFIINGKKNTIKSKKFQFNLNSEIGGVGFNDSGYGRYSKLWIRVNGLAMFEHSTYQKDESSIFEGVIDINESPLKMLTANRDGLQYSYSTKLNNIFQELSNEREKLTYEGMFNFILNEEEENKKIIPIISDIKSSKKIIEENNLLEELSSNTVNYNEDKIENTINKVFKDLSSQQDKFEDFFEIAIKKINQKYYPANFTISTEKKEDTNIQIYKSFFKELLKQKNIRIAIMWNVIVDNILETSFFENYITKNNNRLFHNNLPIFKGFVFGENNLLGSNATSGEGSHISINPINKYISNDFECILDIAIHECSHFLIKEHNSNFCFTEFLLRRAIQKDLKHSKIKNEIKEKFKDLQDKLTLNKI